MDKSEQKVQKYLRAVRRRLNMPKDLKDRVMTDFASSMEARKESGQNIENILAELGNPRQAAAELNKQMAEYCYKKSPWRWACLALAVLSSLSLLNRGIHKLLFSVPEAASVGIIGSADGPTSIIIATSPDALQHAYTMSALLLVMGIVGFIALSRIKKQ